MVNRAPVRGRYPCSAAPSFSASAPTPFWLATCRRAAPSRSPARAPPATSVEAIAAVTATLRTVEYFQLLMSYSLFPVDQQSRADEKARPPPAPARLKRTGVVEEMNWKSERPWSSLPTRSLRGPAACSGSIRGSSTVPITRLCNEAQVALRRIRLTNVCRRGAAAGNPMGPWAHGVQLPDGVRMRRTLSGASTSRSCRASGEA